MDSGPSFLVDSKLFGLHSDIFYWFQPSIWLFPVMYSSWLSWLVFVLELSVVLFKLLVWDFSKFFVWDKPLFKLTKSQRENNKIRNEKGDITTDTGEIHKIITSYFKNLYSMKLENQKEMDNLLDMDHIPNLQQNQINNLNRPVTCPPLRK